MREKLDEMVKEHDLINRSFLYFWDAYDDYLVDDITKDEARELNLVDRDSVELNLYGYSYCVTERYESDIIRVNIDAYYKGTYKQIIEYACLFNLNGECIDDYFATV